MARARGLDVVRALAGTILCSSVILSGNASAQRPPPQAKPLGQSLPADAKRDYDAGKLLFEDGDYATALLMYQAAYDRTHDPRLLWNVAVCKKNLRHYAKAAATLARYLAEGGTLISGSDRRDAQDLVKAIAPFTVTETIKVSEPDAHVFVDDEPVGTSPLPGPLVLDMGTRRVRVRKEGYRPVDREFPVGGSAPTTIDIVLEKQIGHLILNVPEGATVAIDEKEVGRGPRIEVDLPIGAHAARVAAPKMRTLQTDVVVEDGKSRTLDLGLDVESAPSAEIHIAVGCNGPDPLSERELTVFIDDATESAIPLGVRMRREPGREVVAFVPYRVTPGTHHVHVAAAGCSGRDADVVAPEGGIGEVRGELPPANAFFDGSPAGSPDGWRVSGGLIDTSTTMSSYSNFFQTTPAAFGGATPPSVGVNFLGPTASVGLQGRWLTALLDARLLFARVTGTGEAAAFNSTLSKWSIGVRPGVRIPLVIAALSTGFGFHAGQYFFFPDAAGSGGSGAYLSGSFWAAIDIQPFCEWGAQLGGAASADAYYTPQGSSTGTSETSLWLQATYTPNSKCDRRRAGLFKIEGVTH
jgi:hypothetical protein